MAVLSMLIGVEIRAGGILLDSSVWFASSMLLIGTNRTNRAGLAMSVERGRTEVAFRGRQDRF